MMVIVDCLREVPAPFDPESATAELVKVLKSYRCHATSGDRYAANWVVQAFEKRGIT
jgi:hypothetical protein